jgi:hypothetical protein
MGLTSPKAVPIEKEALMTIEWTEPWAAVFRTDEQAGLQIELGVELAEAHPLFGYAVTAIARRYDRDDVLFELPDGRVAEVHLTWRGAKEVDTRWPRAQLFSSVEEWIKERMTASQYE